MDQTDICCEVYPAVKIMFAFKGGNQMEDNDAL